MKQRIWNILISLDQFAQTIVYLGKYNPDITISDVIGRKIKAGTANNVEIALCKILRKLENKHCIKSIEEDEPMQMNVKEI